ncbi:hypothetical protein VTN00DRAFT_2193 [Thermoascus crustaceus]|uniref:uncharacterized protein n=1 Tax=Thermoascus crustaceus TaxID=5088 RepID=UPI0037427FD4
MTLEAARIKSLPDDAYYIPNFVTEDEEERLLQKINNVPLPRWTQLSHRRLQSWPSALTKSTNTLLASPLPSWLSTPIVTPRFDSLGIFADAPHGAPNHVLVNEYRPGQGIMPHEDGAAYHPLVATVSLGAPIVLDLYKKQDRQGEVKEEQQKQQETTGMMMTTTTAKNRTEPQFRILQEPRSLLITMKKMYTDYLHGIAETERDEGLSANTICNWDLLGEKEQYECGWYERETRISLTYRDVLKVAKLGNSVKFLTGR